MVFFYMLRHFFIDGQSLVFALFSAGFNAVQGFQKRGFVACGEFCHVLFALFFKSHFQHPFQHRHHVHFALFLGGQLS